MLQLGAVAGEITVQDVAHLPLKDEHASEDVTAVALAILVIERAVSQNLAQAVAREQHHQVVVLGVLNHLAWAGGVEPPLPGWKPAIRPRKPACYRYTMPIWSERVTGIEPALAYWRYAESRSEVSCAATTLHPPLLPTITFSENFYCVFKKHYCTLTMKNGGFL